MTEEEQQQSPETPQDDSSLEESAREFEEQVEDQLQAEEDLHEEQTRPHAPGAQPDLPAENISPHEPESASLPPTEEFQQPAPPPPPEAHEPGEVDLPSGEPVAPPMTSEEIQQEAEQFQKETERYLDREDAEKHLKLNLEKALQQSRPQPASPSLTPGQQPPQQTVLPREPGPLPAPEAAQFPSEDVGAAREFEQEVEQFYRSQESSPSPFPPGEPDVPTEPSKREGLSARTVDVRHQINVTVEASRGIAEEIARQMEPAIRQLYERLRYELEDALERKVILMEQGKSVP